MRATALLLDDLLDVSRITRGKLPLRPAPVALAAVVDRQWPAGFRSSSDETGRYRRRPLSAGLDTEHRVAAIGAVHNRTQSVLARRAIFHAAPADSLPHLPLALRRARRPAGVGPGAAIAAVAACNTARAARPTIAA
jgi:hypothetical protein